jgi:hypothetical protein
LEMDKIHSWQLQHGWLSQKANKEEATHEG